MAAALAGSAACPSEGESKNMSSPTGSIPPPDRILAAAIWTEDGRVESLPAPARHHDVIHHMVMKGFTEREIHLAEQGFVTGQGVWAQRRPALRIAHAAGQFLPGAPAHPEHGLFSEDLW